jgi:CheY-like chemotaxis protein
MSGKKCLLVEDHVETAYAITDYLKAFFPNWQMTQCSTGKEALSRATSEAPDVIILDIALADDLDGLEVVRRLAQVNLPKKPRIIIVTALGRRDFRGPKPGWAWVDQLKDSERKFVFAFFEKPFRWKEFIATLAQAAEVPLPASLEDLSEL